MYRYMYILTAEHAPLLNIRHFRRAASMPCMISKYMQVVFLCVIFADFILTMHIKIRAGINSHIQAIRS